MKVVKSCFLILFLFAFYLGLPVVKIDLSTFSTETQVSSIEVNLFQSAVAQEPEDEEPEPDDGPEDEEPEN